MAAGAEGVRFGWRSVNQYQTDTYWYNRMQINIIRELFWFRMFPIRPNAELNSLPS